MQNVIMDNIGGTIVISEQFSLTESHQFSKPGDTYSIYFINLKNIQKFKSFQYDTTGTNSFRYLTTQYRLSRDGDNWTVWLDLDENITNFPPWDPKSDMFIEIMWIRSGDSGVGIISLLDWSMSGLLSRDLITTSPSTVYLQNGQSTIIKPPFIYKVFKITDMEILSTGDMTNTSIMYRYSQDYGRTVSNWTNLTKDNISSERINPIRFFQLEYLIQSGSQSSVKIFDINLVGDFQNVTLDGQKTNLLGLRENCNCLILGLVNDQNETTTPYNGPGESDLLTGDACNSSTDSLYTLTPTDISKLYQPYQQTQALNLLSKMSSDANAIFGHPVVYVLTDPDKKGIDYTFHEYQLYNYVCTAELNVSVDGNNFPDNQITMNQFDLSLFESFEIHIPKTDFKNAFGVEKRPSKEDFLWFCEVNRMFQVEHAQQFRNFNNASVYYKIMLKKYSQKSNIIAGNKTIEETVNNLKKNSTIDELFGLENMQDKKSIANKEEFKTLTLDLLRLEILAEIDKELIENSTTIISKSNYDMSSVPYGATAVVYHNFKNYFPRGDNTSFVAWFNINNYTVNDVYNFFTYYDSNNQGIKINLESDTFTVTYNDTNYDWEMIGSTMSADALLENVWYCYIVNIDQRNKQLSQWIYKRNVEEEEDAGKLNSTVLQMVYNNLQSFVPDEFELDNTTQASILGSDMKLTNLRMFIDIIPASDHNKILNQYTIGTDYKYVIFVDNANTRLVLPNYTLNTLNNDPETAVRRGTRKDEL